MPCKRVHGASCECVLRRGGVVVIRALLPQVFWVWCPAMPVWMGSPGMQVLCTSLAGLEPSSAGSLGSSCWLEMQPGLGKGKRCTKSYRVLPCSFPLCFHHPFQLDEFSSLVSQRSVVIAGVTHCS